MDRLSLERRQVWLYLAAILAGLAAGSRAPNLAPVLEALLWPVLALLLYTTFAQVPLLHLRDAWPPLAVVLLPLGMAAASERWIEARPERTVVRDRLAGWSVVLLALVVFLVAGAQVRSVIAVLDVLPRVVPVFIAFLLLAAPVAKIVGAVWRLPPEHGRTLAFSFGTRNSFVVLPLALGLPPGWEVAAVVIVVQSLVELFGMAAYLQWVPRLFRH